VRKIFSKLKDFLNKDKYSIRTRIITIFIIIIIILNLVFFLSYIRRENEIEIYQNNVEVNFKLNELSLELSENYRYLESYLQSREAEDREVYMKSRRKIDRLMEEVKPDVEKDQDSKTFYRYLYNMLDYNDQLLVELLNSRELNENTYLTLTKLDKLHSYMNSHSQNLINSYMDYHSTNYVDLLLETQNRSKTIYTVIIFISIGVFIFALLLSNDILKAIDKLSYSAKYLSLGHWEVEDIEEIKYKELNILAKTFNLMKNNIKKYIDELKEKSELENRLNKQKMKNIEKERLLKESQLLNLQMQMDPHFLFNTLNTVSRTAMFENASETQKLIIAISKIMRYNLDHKGKLVDLQKEIEVLKAYLTIQQTRFKEQMDFNVITEGDISGIKIPPMILQPLVENSIIHGLSDIDTDGEVIIEIIRAEDELKIKIKDNGSGIKEDKLKKLFNDNEDSDSIKDEDKEKEREGLGILNVKKRLELHYGKNLLSIKSKLNHGTEVNINIPLMEGESNV